MMKLFDRWRVPMIGAGVCLLMPLSFHAFTQEGPTSRPSFEPAPDAPSESQEDVFEFYNLLAGRTRYAFTKTKRDE